MNLTCMLCMELSLVKYLTGLLRKKLNVRNTMILKIGVVCISVIVVPVTLNSLTIYCIVLYCFVLHYIVVSPEGRGYEETNEAS